MAKPALRPPLRPALRERPYHPKNIGESTGSGFLRGRFYADLDASRKSCSEGNRVKSLEHKKQKKLSAEEQEKALFSAIKHKWNDMDYRFVNIAEIKDFLNAIARVCIHSRDAERAAYAGGAYTGIGIDRYALQRDANNPKYNELIRVLGACLSSKYLERREINNGNTIVFYLNRWLCAYYGLPLSYGGWAKFNFEKLSRINNIDYFEDNQEQTQMKW